jgi:hypothetical protein
MGARNPVSTKNLGQGTRNTGKNPVSSLSVHKSYLRFEMGGFEV